GQFRFRLKLIPVFPGDRAQSRFGTFVTLNNATAPFNVRGKCREYSAGGGGLRNRAQRRADKTQSGIFTNDRSVSQSRASSSRHNQRSTASARSGPSRAPASAWNLVSTCASLS